jgi:TolB protein
VVNADGSGRKQLTDDSVGGLFATWSPDGSRIAFMGCHEDRAEVWVVNADGSHQERLTTSLGGDWFPAWSPDGKRIAFVYGPKEPEGAAKGEEAAMEEVHLVNADGSGRRRLVQGAGGSPAWSPDGSRLAVALKRGENCDIYTVALTDAHETRLTEDPADDVGPLWSPDGSRIAFASKRHGNLDVFVMGAGGSDETRLTRNPLDETPESWAPDGARIAFTRRKSGDDSAATSVWVMDADGSHPTRLNEGNTEAEHPAWSPDGRRIALGYSRGGVYGVALVKVDGLDWTDLTKEESG